MPKPERKAVILDYFANNEIMLTSGMTHRQLIEYRSVTFSQRTTKRMLTELVADGLMKQVDRGANPLYTITADGRAWLTDFEQS